jgi:hypothetical protein
MAIEVAKLLCLDQVNQYKTTNGGYKTTKEVFNNFLWFNMRHLKLILSEDYKSLDEKAFIEKYHDLS